MAEIVEVIHKINYEVNDAALQRAASLISTQLEALTKLQTQLSRLQHDISATQGAAFEKMAANLTRLTALIEKETGKTKGMFAQLGSSIGSSLSIGVDLAETINNLSTVFSKAGNSGTGFISTVGSFATKINPVLRIGSILLPILGELTDKFLNTGKAVGELDSQIDKLAEERKQIAGFAASEMADLFILKTKIEDVNTAYTSRLESINQLKEQNPGFFEHLKEEEILAGRVSDAYEKIVQNILALAKTRVLENQLQSQVEQLLPKQQAIRKKAGDSGITLVRKKTGLPGFETFDLPDAINTEILNSEISRPAADNLTPISKPLNTPKKEGTVVPDNLAQLIHSYNGEVTKLKLLLQEILDTQKTVIPSTHKRNINKVYKTTNENTVVTPGRTEEKIAPLDSIPSSINHPGKKPGIAAIPPGSLELKQHRNEIKKTIDAYTTLSAAAAQSFQTIYDAQIKALDKEIDIRQKRVDAATKLAERGNTEVLKLEQEKLEAAQKQREEYARRQQVVNAALAVSNAVVAVAQAAGQSGAGAIVIVPAVIAAIIAGYAAISAATRESTAQAFADGVINYRGIGGPRDDANWVRISSGESIITAAGTAANHPILEAINNGVQFKLLDMPVLKSPGTIQTAGGDNSKQSIKALEKKLDSVITAIEDNRMKQNIYFNEQGVGIMTQKAIKRDQNRYR